MESGSGVKRGGIALGGGDSFGKAPQAGTESFPMWFRRGPA